MLTVTKPAPNRLDIELSGKLDAAAMDQALDRLIEGAEDMVHGKMLYTITDFAMPSLGALGVELRRLPRLFSLIGKFDRCAVLANAGWIRTAAEIEGKLIPGITIKAFGLDERETAEAWLASG